MSLYRQYFTSQEIALLDATPQDDLTSEINLLQVMLARLLATWQHTKDLALQQQAAILRAISAATRTIAALLRLQVELHNPLDEIRATVERAKEEARRRRHVHDYFSCPVPAE